MNGLIISIIMKYLSNIVRLFMIGSSMVLTTILSCVIFGYKMDIYFGLAFLMVIGALYFYYFEESESTAPPKSTKRV